MFEIRVHSDNQEHFTMSFARVPIMGDFLIAKGKRFKVTAVFFYETGGVDLQVKEC